MHEVPGSRIDRMRRVTVALAASAALASLSVHAVAQPRPAPAPRSPGPAAGQTAFDEAQRAFEALPEGERRAIQDALVWTGDFNGTVTGQFGRRTFEAIQAYQRRARLDANGILDRKARAGLEAAARQSRHAVKFGILDDPRTGARIGIPQRMLVRTEAAPGPGGGTRWQSADEAITLDTRHYPSGEPDLPALFERLTASQAPGRKVTYKILRPDFLVVSGETAAGRFYVRYAGGTEGIRGFTLGYGKALGKDFDRLVVAIANSFVPFPDKDAAASVPPPPRPGLSPVAPPARPAGPVATGLMVAPRRVLTAASVETCADPRVGGARARLLRADKASGLALVEVDDGRTAPPLPVRSAALPADAPVVVLAFAQGTAGAGLLVAPGEGRASGRILAPLQPGASGAPVFDRDGALAGLVGSVPPTPRMIAGIVPPATYPLIAGDEAARFLGEAGIRLETAAPGPERSAGEIAAAFGAAVVPVACAP